MLVLEFFFLGFFFVVLSTGNFCFSLVRKARQEFCRQEEEFSAKRVVVQEEWVSCILYVRGLTNCHFSKFWFFFLHKESLDDGSAGRAVCRGQRGLSSVTCCCVYFCSIFISICKFYLPDVTLLFFFCICSHVTWSAKRHLSREGWIAVQPLGFEAQGSLSRQPHLNPVSV